MIAFSDIKYASYKENLLDLFLPDESASTVYIYIHGGGIEGGSYKIGNKLPDFYTSCGIAFASIEYRLYPNAKFPEYIIDCANAVKYIQDNYDFENIIIGGSSAGGYISMMLFFNKQYFIDAAVNTSKIKGYIFDAGQPTSHFNYLRFDKKVDSRSVMIDEGAPIFYLREDYPPCQPHVFFICAENDMTNRVNQTNVLITAMKQFKFPTEKLFYKIYENETHCSYLTKELYLNDTYNFIKNALGGYQ